MSQANQPFDLAAHIRRLQTVVGAILAGAVIILAIVVGLRLSGQFAGAPETPILTYVAAAFAIGVLAAQYFVPGMVVNARLQKIAATGGPFDPTRELAQILTNFTIIGVALLEGGMFMQAIAYLQEGRQVVLLIAVFLVAKMGMAFPTQSGVENWLATQQQAMREARNS